MIRTIRRFRANLVRPIRRGERVMRTKLVRCIGTMAISFAIVALSVVIVHASSDYDTFCYNWHLDHHTEGDQVWCESPYQWYWDGGWDFSSMDESDYMNESTNLCDDEIFSCWDTCQSSEYIDWALEQEFEHSGYQCTYDPSCIDSWAYTTCDEAAQSGFFHCECGYMNICLEC